MKIIFIFLSLLPVLLHAQQNVDLVIRQKQNGLPAAATLSIKELRKTIDIDSNGHIVVAFPSNGKFTLTVTAAGFENEIMGISIPFKKDSLIIELTLSEHEMEEIIVQSTRTSRTIRNVPTRIEMIELEEIDEKNNMRPANVAMLLHESTGIQVQQTSATSGNASVRIQGLDGRYTQLLKDGFPSFGNFSSGLSLLEIPPLDLKQVEIIKGPASPLFGGGAIAGVINFISKTPTEEPAHNFIINYSNIGQFNAGGFIARRGKKAGFTLLALYSRQKLYDVDKDDFTEVPDAHEVTLHPKLFIYPDDRTTIEIGNSFTTGRRMGGDIFVVKGSADAQHQYFETNKTLRNTSTFVFDRKLQSGGRLTAKQSFSFFDRSIEVPGYRFAGASYQSFTDISYLVNKGKHSLVVGGNFLYDQFREKKSSAANRDNLSRTAGFYSQHTWDASPFIKLESGLRVDFAQYSNAVYSNSNLLLLPRVSLLVTCNSKLTSRIGAGMGYKLPTLFTERTETIQYRDVAQLDAVDLEKSYGTTADVNYTTRLFPGLSFSLNHMFFYTIIDDPLILQTGINNSSYFMNASRPVHSAGFETNLKFIYQDHLKLFLGYTFTDAKAKYQPGNQFLTLVPKSKLNSALIYEKEGVIKLGLEAYFTGRQYLSTGLKTPAFTELGFMAEKIFNSFSLYINFENFGDTRQSRYKSVVNGSHLDPSFDEIWTHTEGFVINGGIKLKF